ncbi:MAG: hypothetical protein JXA82_05725 [Sedimentisphaerales bacterium]|nr:hypothetical protein [Sedimentisphaerales bacterium]
MKPLQILMKKQIWISLCISFVVMDFASAEDSNAQITVSGNAPLDVQTMSMQAVIHPNRQYTFGDVPDALLGLQYLRHQHKNPAVLECKVEEAGLLVLCLWADTTPEKLKLPGKWAPIGTMTESTGTDRWSVFQTQVEAGMEFQMPVPDRWGAVLMARKIKLRVDRTSDQYDLVAEEILSMQSLTSERRNKLRREALCPDSVILDSDRDPVDVILRRTKLLINHLVTVQNVKNLSNQVLQFQNLQRLAEQTDVSKKASRRELFNQLCMLRRTIAFSNPLLDFKDILFLTHHKALYNHMVDQYYGFHAQPGGGLYVLKNAFSDHPILLDVLANSIVQNGRLKGQKLTGGAFISLELSYDGQEILFAWSQAKRTINEWSPESTYHLFSVNLDGSNLRQLTDGSWNEFDPCYLPNGRIAFISERRGGYLRCSGKGGRPNPTYALFQMDPSGADIIPLSYHETHEWHPSVDNNGMLVYTRWDYVDRDSDIAHHIWISYPDGHDPRSYHGNYPLVREHRPWMEMSIRAIPDSHRYVAVAAPHHGQAYGSLVLIDPRLDDDRAMSQLKRITPEVPFPESEGRPYQKYEIYGSPWPLSDNFYLCVYDSGAAHYGIYLVDSFGNRELLWRDPEAPCLDPIPLQPRARPPVIASPVVDSQDNDAMETVAVINVYDSDFDWPENTTITALRVVQLFPKATPREYEPNIGVGRQSLARGVLGTVPVESDGSACFKAPVGVPLYFQALDAKGTAVQTMRSATYLQPGRPLVCQGCHEHKRRSPSNSSYGMVKALRREPSELQAESYGSYPLTFAGLVQPVLNARCMTCHAKESNAPNLSPETDGEYGWSKSYQILGQYAWTKHGGNGSIAQNKTSYSIPGQVGARASRLYKMLTTGSHKDRVDLTQEEMYRITLWLDCNSNFFGAYNDLAAQAKGDIVLPDLF